MTERKRTMTHAELVEEIEAIRDSVDELRTDISGLVKAWENATFLVATIKWVAGAFTALSALYYVVTHFGQGK